MTSRLKIKHGGPHESGDNYLDLLRYGLLLSLMLIGMSGIKSLGGTLVGMLILFAWVCHIMMSINWVADKPVQRWVPAYGTLTGVIGLMFWPVADSSFKEFAITDILFAVAIGLSFTLPCFLLAMHLVRFHLRAQSDRANPYVSQPIIPPDLHENPHSLVNSNVRTR